MSGTAGRGAALSTAELCATDVMGLREIGGFAGDLCIPEVGRAPVSR